MRVPKYTTTEDKGDQGKSRVCHNLKPPRVDVKRHHGLDRADKGRPEAKC